MRKYLGLVGLTLGLTWAASAQAQNLTITPNIANNSPMSYVNPFAPVGGAFSRPSNNGSAFPLRMNQLFYTPSRTNTFSNTITRGTSTFPTPAQMQASAPSYFRAFQMYRAAPIRPQ
jgi:hypothetical protein